MESNDIRKKEIILDKVVRAGFVERHGGSGQIPLIRVFCRKNKTKLNTPQDSKSDLRAFVKYKES